MISDHSKADNLVSAEPEKYHIECGDGSVAYLYLVDGPAEEPAITTQLTAPSVSEGESPVGSEIKVEATSSSGKTLTYQWYYNTTNSATGGTQTGSNSSSCTIPELEPGDYWFYCVITDSDGNTVTTNTVKIVIPAQDGNLVNLNPGETVTTDNGVTVKRTPKSGDGGKTVTIDKNDGQPDTTIELPNAPEDGDVTVDKTNGKVNVPGGSTVKDGDGTSGKPDVTLGDKGGAVNNDGSVTIPEGGSASVGGGNGGTIITAPAGSGDVTVTPKEDGTVEVGKDGGVKPGGGSGTAEVILPGGGSVNTEDGSVTPNERVAGVDTDGDGEIDTLVALPGADGGDSAGDKLKQNGNGGYDVPGNTVVTGGEGGASATLPNGGEVTPGGGVKPSGDGTVLTGKDGKTEVKLPDGGEIKGSGDGGLEVPGGTTVKNGEDGAEITIGGSDGGNGGTLNKDGGVDLPAGGKASVDNGKDETGNAKPGTEITSGAGGGTVKPNPDGTTGVSGGSTVKTGENGTEITMGDPSKPSGGNGGTVDGDGNVTLPGGGSAVISGDGNDNGTVVTVPENGGTIDPGENGNAEVPDGSKVKPGNTDGNSAEITLPNGGGVNGGSGEIVPGKDENGKQIAGVDADGDGTIDTLVVLPGADGGDSAGDKLKQNGNGGYDVPGNTVVTGGADGASATLPNGGEVTPGGGVKPGGDGTVKTGEDGKTEVKIPSGGEIKGDGDGGLKVPGGTTVKNGEDGAEITIGGSDGGNGGTLNKDGGVDLPAGGKASVDNGDGKPGTEITSGAGGGTVSPNPDGSVGVSDGSTVQTGENNPAITVVGNGASVGSGGQVNLPANGSAAITVPGPNGSDSITVTTPNSGTVDQDGKTTASKIEITSGGKDEKPTVITAPAGGKVTTGSDGTTKLPVGASVSKEGGNGKTTITVNSAGTTPTVDKGGLLTFPSGGDVTVEKTVTGKEPKTFPITIPEGGTINADSTGATDITGIVTVGKGSDERAGNANVKLMRGKNLIMSSRTNEDGEFYLINISKGFYNIIASREDRNGQATAIMESDGKPEQEVPGLYLPSDNVFSILDIKGEKDEKAAVDITEVVVGGLNDEAEEIKKERGAESVDLRLEIAPADKTANASETTAIRNLDSAKGRKLEYLAVDMKLIVNAQGLETLTNTKTIFEIILPFTFSSAKGDVMVYRYHDGSASGLNSVNGRANPSDGTYFANEASGCIHIFTNKFSTYAIGYVPSDGQIPDDSTQDGDTTPPESENPTPTPEPENPAPSGSGSSSSGSGSGVRVAPNVTGGKVTISPARPTRGQTVTITVTPDEGYRLDSLTVTGIGGKAVELTKVGDGQYTFVMPAGSVTVTPSFVKVDSEVTADSRRFTDVSDDDWFAEYVEYVAANGLMNGYSDGRFGPNDNTTRGQIITVLYRYEQEPETGLSGFSDVDSGKYYAKAVAWGAANGIVKGYGANLFGPEDNITREQLAAILFRFAEFKGRDVSARADLSGFADNGKISNYARPALEWAVASGLMNGKSNSMLDPNGFATRAEVAAMLMRFIEA